MEKYVIGNQDATKFFRFRFDGGIVRKFSAVTLDLEKAELFDTRDQAQAVIDQGKTGTWGAVTLGDLYYIHSVEVEYSLKGRAA